jgi:hypothetical protein
VGISSTTKWAVIDSDGTSSPVASSLTPLLNNIGFPGNFLVAPSTLYMVQQFPSEKNPFKFYELNLATGAILRSDSMVPLSGSRTVLFEPENIDLAAHLLTFLIANTTFEHVQINALSVVTLNLTTNALAVRPLAPGIADDLLPPAGIPQYLTNAYVSGDGSLLIYQTPSGSATYILDLKTGRTSTIPSDMNLMFIGGQNSVYYSPTDQYAALIGVDASQALKFFIVDTATGTIVKNLAPLIPNAVQFVQIMGWASPTRLIYASDASTSASADRADVFDLQSGTTSPFPAVDGQFIGLLP